MKSINNCIPAQLSANLGETTRLTALVAECLSIQLREAVECIGIKGDSLSLLADSPAVNSQLRFYHEAILKALTQNGYQGVNRVTCRTRPSNNTPRPVKSQSASRATVPLSNETRAQLAATAKTILDPKLRRALNKLSSL